MIDQSKMLAAIAASGDKNIKLPFLTQKLKWSVQIEGCYDLLYKYINADYPTRQEMQKYMDMSFKAHDKDHLHNGLNAYSIPTIIVDSVPMPQLSYLLDKTPVKANGAASNYGAGV